MTRSRLQCPFATPHELLQLVWGPSYPSSYTPTEACQSTGQEEEKEANMGHIHAKEIAWCLESVLRLAGVGSVCKIRAPTVVPPSVHISFRVQAPGKLMRLVKWS